MTTIPGMIGAPQLVPGLIVRAIRPDDAPSLQAFHHRLSPDTVRNRFFGVHPDLPASRACARRGRHDPTDMVQLSLGPLSGGIVTFGPSSAARGRGTMSP